MHQALVPNPQASQQGMPPSQSMRPMQYQPQPPQQQYQHQMSFQPQQPGYPQNYTPGYPQSPAQATHHQTMNNPLASGYNQMPLPPAGRTPMAPQPGAGMPHANMYNPPRPPEVYTLSDNVNEALPADVRQLFQHDAAGRVLFFTAPPLDRSHKGISSESAGLGHSVQYLAGREEWLAARERKRKERDENEREEAGKRVALDSDSNGETAKAVTSQALDAMDTWFQQFEQDTQRWTKDAGLEGWPQAVGGSA